MLQEYLFLHHHLQRCIKKDYIMAGCRQHLCILKGGYTGLIFLFGFFVLICVFLYIRGKREIDLQSKGTIV